MGRFKIEDDLRIHAPAWVRGHNGTVRVDGALYHVSMDPNFRAWAVRYVYDNNGRYPLPVYGPVSLKTRTTCGIGDALQAYLKKLARKGRK